MKSTFLAAGLLLSLFVSGQSQDEMAIRRVLEEQTQAWNRHDVTGFMKGYWNNDSLMFIGKSGVTYGWVNSLERYKKGYPDTASMGKLDFNLLTVQRLSDENYNIVGQWHLTRSIGDISGYFTLLFRKINGAWLITQDHSS